MRRPLPPPRRPNGCSRSKPDWLVHRGERPEAFDVDVAVRNHSGEPGGCNNKCEQHRVSARSHRDGRGGENGRDSLHAEEIPLTECAGPDGVVARREIEVDVGVVGQPEHRDRREHQAKYQRRRSRPRSPRREVLGAVIESGVGVEPDIACPPRWARFIGDQHGWQSPQSALLRDGESPVHVRVEGAVELVGTGGRGAVKVAVLPGSMVTSNASPGICSDRVRLGVAVHHLHCRSGRSRPGHHVAEVLDGDGRGRNGVRRGGPGRDGSGGRCGAARA